MLQFSLLTIDALAAVMSGDMGDWLAFGSRVGVFVFSVMYEEFCKISAMRAPLWSSELEYHMVECAFMSPVMMLLVSESRYSKVLVMSVSSVAWSGSVVCLGAI